MKAKAWTEAHRREALRRIFELGAELASEHGRAAAYRILAPWFDHHGPAADPTQNEEQFRALLSGAVVEFARDTLTPARIDREVRRVRGLAEGQLVREEHYRGGVVHYDEREEAARAARRCGVALVRVTRIRRAVR